MLQPIPTKYKGYVFRSRLEARWAVFFDACGVEWEYEPEGYDLGDGVHYLPDFLLHNVTINHGIYKKGCDIYVEVKGKMTDSDAEKIFKFYEAGKQLNSNSHISASAVLVVGPIPDGDEFYTIIDNIHDKSYGGKLSWPAFYNFETIDDDYFAAYPGISRNGKFELFGDDSSYLCDADKGRTTRAYCIARQARFEFGQTPKVWRKNI